MPSLDRKDLSVLFTFPLKISKELGSTIPRKEFERREWLETTRGGCWAMSSLQGIHTRRYHGEFISGESAHRYNLVSSLNETLQSTHGSIPLRSTFYPDAIHPDGYRFLEQFSRELHPVFTFRAGEITVRKSVVALSERDLILFQYEYDGPPQDDLRLSLEPLFAFREIHALTHSTVHQSLSIEKTDESIYRVSSSPDLPSCSLLIPESDFSYHPLWHYAVTYPMEEERGFPAKEDLRSLGSFTCPFPAYRPLLIAIGGRDLEAFSQEELHKRYQGELRRRHDQRKGAFHHRTECLTERERLLLETLVQAADQFLITDTAGDVRLLAGYPWFYEWGRDTFISLPGLCCATGRFADGAALLTRFARKIQYGLIPNRFLEESTETAEYNSVDASLWFAVAAGSFCREQPENTSLSDLLFAVMKEIITAFRAGTLFDIQVDHDGFLRAGNANTQLTWMDAKVGDEAITPRHGKAVELNALWYNLLCFFRERCTVRGEDDELLTSVCAELSTFQERFQAMFWNETDQCLFDLITEEGKDSSIRPNQIFALSLPFPLLAQEHAQKVLSCVEEHLLTPYGLRTLSPRDPAFVPRYEGGPEQRDRAYHKGTVWPWLLGPYLTAKVRFGAKGKEIERKEARTLFFRALEGLLHGGIGTLSEIYDGTAPHLPRGCPAQAWSVAELLRVYREDLMSSPL